jgi:hypothetical protein
MNIRPILFHDCPCCECGLLLHCSPFSVQDTQINSVIIAINI